MPFQPNIISIQGPPKGHQSQKGRARRPRYGKPTTAIHARQAASYERAVDRAEALNLAFVNVTITWGLTVRPAVDDLANVKWLREAVRKWLQRHGDVEFYDLGVREDAAVKGPHWHWLVHCPSYLRGEKQGQLGHYIRKVLLPHTARSGLQVTTKKYKEDCEGCGRPRNWQHLARCYFLKGSTDAVRERNGINACASASPQAAETHDPDQGAVTGKRLFHSRSLGDKASGALTSRTPAKPLAPHWALTAGPVPWAAA
jgi:hypothetical protein